MRKTVSLIMAASFGATAITGLLMMFGHVRAVTPGHELMALIFTLAAVFHIALNAKCIGRYVKERAVLATIATIVTIAIVVGLAFHNPHKGRGEEHRFGPESHSLDRD